MNYDREVDCTDIIHNFRKIQLGMKETTEHKVERHLAIKLF